MSLETIIIQLAVGLLKSIAIFALTLIGSLPLGLFVAFGRMSKWAPLKGLAPAGSGRLRKILAGFRPLQTVVKLYISLMRGTPLMLQLMVVYFGPYYLFKIPIGQNYRFTAVVIGFVLNYAAYFAEIYRSGIAAGDQAHPALHHQRGDHAGQGHLACLRHLLFRDVHPGPQDLLFPVDAGALRRGWHLLLSF